MKTIEKVLDDVIADLVIIRNSHQGYGKITIEIMEGRVTDYQANLVGRYEQPTVKQQTRIVRYAAEEAFQLKEFLYHLYSIHFPATKLILTLNIAPMNHWPVIAINAAYDKPILSNHH